MANTKEPSTKKTSTSKSSKRGAGVTKKKPVSSKKSVSAAKKKTAVSKKTTNKSKSVKKPVKKVHKIKNKIKKVERKHVFGFGVALAAIAVVFSLVIPATSQQIAEAKIQNIVCKSKNGTVIEPNTKVYTKYGISGYFMFTSSNGCFNRSQVERAHKMGADTIVTFGSTLKGSSAAMLASDNTFKNFKIKGQPGYNYIKNVSGAKINRVFTYSDKLTYGKKALSCGSKRNGVQTVGESVYTWWLFPTDSSYSSCSSPSNNYDLVVSYSASKTDGNLVMVSNASRYGMKVYLGLPKPQGDPKVPYRADSSYHHTLGSFATRMLSTWNERYGNVNAFAGVYQTLETPVFSNQSIWAPNLKVYSILNAVTTYQLPKAKERVLISPYANLNAQPSSRIQPSYSAIVKTANGARIILAPQDGVGTGAVGMNRVETFYAQSKKAGAPEFWANVEAFKPGGAVGNRPNTNKATLDAQIAKAKKYTPKVISYNWKYMESSGIVKQILGNNY